MSILNPDYLRSIDQVSSPDPRNLNHSIFDEKGGARLLEITDRHESISKLKFGNSVPEDVVIEFETVKNLYLYSWFVYRFYPVSELYAYICLELALRIRFENEITPKTRKKVKTSPGLKVLLSHAIKTGHIKNEGFEIWHHTSEVRAHHRTVIEKIEEMDRLGLMSIAFDETKIEIMDEDKNHNYLNIILETIPYLRNEYAHGNPGLDKHAYTGIKIVWEIIKQIF